jgi:hypothetical protein
MAVAVILAPFNFNGRVIILWSVWRIGTLGDDTVELLSDVPHPLLDVPFYQLGAASACNSLTR